MAKLRLLSLQFSLPTCHVGISLPSRKRIVLPALIRLDFRGITEYLEDLVAEIDAPRLEYIYVALLNESISDLSKLIKFVNRIEMHRSHRRAHILSSKHSISVSLTRPRAPTCLKFQLFRKELSKQLDLMAQICIHVSAFLFNVKDLHVVRRYKKASCSW
ncbi:hypothetical protein BJY52DRAFT_1343218 [Lactarius psammicola]|nr:hypothetical protein BJY52DRAFT_1343218 [Lactarius psammicola]